MAKKALRKEDPRVYASLVNPDDPRIDEVGGQATFTWEYLQRTSDNATAIHTVTITLTGDGRILALTFD
jgi:hypothetical protein